MLTDVTAAAGIDWVQQDDNTMMGAGGAFLDFDGDGWLDVLLAGGVSTPGLYRNLRDGTFAEVSPSPFAVSLGEEYLCTAVADFDNDGDPDVFFARYGPNLLYRNDGGGRFVDITTPALAMGIYTFTTAAAFGDYDRDGNLDLYVGNYIAPGSSPPVHTPSANFLFRGHGDGTFTDVTDPVLAGAGTALATTWSDFDGDGDADILLGNDFGSTVEPNQIYRNDGARAGGWNFTECGAAMGANIAIYCMGIAIGDCDRDGDFDYYFTNLGRNVMLRNDGPTFVDITTQTGTEVTYDPSTSPPLLATSWGCGFVDFDHDGWLDLYVSNGFVPASPPLVNGTNTRNTLFHHNGPALTFSEVPLQLDDGIGRGAAFGDYDNDGDVDVLQCNVSGAQVLLRNDSPRRGSWFGLDLTGRSSNRDALGVHASLIAGGVTLVRELSRNHSFEASSSPRLHWGLGPARIVEQVSLRWPSGVEQAIHDLPVDHALAFAEPSIDIVAASVRAVGGPSGAVLLFSADLRNVGEAAATAVYTSQLRAAHSSAATGQSGGAVLWSDPGRPIRLGPNSQRTVRRALRLPRGLSTLPPSLDFVWVVADAGGAVDEAKLPSR